MKADDQHEVAFIPSGRGKAQCPPDPNYPHGKAIEGPLTEGSTCKIMLPYMVSECGYLLVRCNVCLQNMLLTVAGRPDDPISVALPCMLPNCSEDGQNRLKVMYQTLVMGYLHKKFPTVSLEKISKFLMTPNVYIDGKRPDELDDFTRIESLFNRYLHPADVF